MKMQSLEKIAENPMGANITELLVLASDPLGDFKKINGGEISSKQTDEVVEALQHHFAYGQSLIPRLRYHLQGLEPGRGKFTSVLSVPNTFELLKLILKNMNLGY